MYLMIGSQLNAHKLVHCILREIWIDMVNIPSLVVDLVSVTRGVDNVESELDTIFNNN
jgi:hypothetical protein